MTRVKRAMAAHKKRRKTLKATKGFMWGRKSRYKVAKDALRHAYKYSYRDRKTKKRDFRRLWQIQINAAVRPRGLSYNRFINGIKKAEIELDRKILAKLAEKQPKIFEKIVEKIKNS